MRIGVLGCGPIAQAAHFESCTKARNADLYAICDVADDLRERMAVDPRAAKSLRRLRRDARRSRARRRDRRHRRRLPRRRLDRARSRPASTCSCEKPVGVAVEEAEALARRGRSAPARVLQVGHMKRFDAGLAGRARRSSTSEMGELLALKAWYCDSHPSLRDDRRRAAADRHQRAARKPAGNPKADLSAAISCSAHGSHLVDTARFLGGDIVEVERPAVASGSAPIAGSSTSTSPAARSAIST